VEDGDRQVSPLREQLNHLFAATQFLTIAPPVIKRMFTPREMGGAVAYFPVVGLGLGLALVLLNALLSSLFPASVSAALLLAGWVILTGAFHLDGYLDACDGLFGGFNPEKRLEIMKDERVGAFALSGGVLLLLSKYAALAALPYRSAILLLAPMLGRAAMSWEVVLTPYARKEGLGRTMKDQVVPRQVAAVSVVVALMTLLLVGWHALIYLAAASLTAWGVARFVMARIPGLTGDIYGATCELVELAVLLTATAL
jgi:adenosylcobinamide-GDP ribazoletransferase